MAKYRPKRNTNIIHHTTFCPIRSGGAGVLQLATLQSHTHIYVTPGVRIRFFLFVGYSMRRGVCLAASARTPNAQQ